MRLLPFEYAVRNLGRSASRLLLSVVGSALVVTLVLAAGAFVRGMELSLRSTGNPGNVMVFGAGSEDSVERSEINAGVTSLIAAAIPGIRTRAGVPFVSPEVHVQLPLRVSADSAKAPLVMVRGVTPAAMLVHQQVQIVDGRLPQQGTDEVIVGAMAATKMGANADQLAVGRTLIIEKRPWTIVGRFVAPGTVTESEIWMPMRDLMEATKRETISAVVVTLEPGEAEGSDITAFTRTRVDLELAAIEESKYYDKLAAFFGPVRVVAWVTAGLIALGGLLGGLNTMYAAFASRVRELGTLQSLGYRRGAIVVSLVQESVLATAAGALIAAGLGVFLLDGLAVRFSMGAFGLTVDARVMMIGLMSGLLLGVIGALPPAWRCLRMPIPTALKAV